MSGRPYLFALVLVACNGKLAETFCPRTAPPLMRTQLVEAHRPLVRHSADPSIRPPAIYLYSLKTSHRIYKQDNTRTFLAAKTTPDQEEPIQEYNDDAFGLVFLCGALVAQDVLFASTFLLTSAVAAIATRQGKVVFRNQIPASVAAFSFLISLALTTAVAYLDLDPSWMSYKSPSALMIELAVCSASVLYGFVFRRQ